MMIRYRPSPSHLTLSRFSPRLSRYKPLRLSFQDRAHVQASCASGWFTPLPFLDVGHDSIAIPERQPVSSSQVGALPQTSPRQDSCLPYLHPNWHHRPWLATVSLGRVSEIGLVLVRIVAQNHSSRHSTIGTCCRKSDARYTSRFSHELRQTQFSRKIHGFTAG